MELLYRATSAGETGIFISFEESDDAIRRNARSLGWDVDALEDEGKLVILDGRIDPRTIRAGEFDINGLLAILGGQAEQINARYVVIDAIESLLRILADPHLEREQLERLHRWLIDHDLTSVLTVKSGEDCTGDHYRFLDFMVDCVIELDQRVTGQVSTRRLRVLKYRGSAFERNEFPFAITDTGVRLVPVSGVELVHHVPDRLLATGNSRLDELLGGGLVASAITLVSGASGTGKTSLAATITLAACQRGERVLYVQFEEAGPVMISRMLSPGIDLRPALESGRLRINATMPESRGIEEHLIHILNAVEQHQPDLLVIDAISATIRIATRPLAYDFLVRLTNACRREGITGVLTHQAQTPARLGEIGAMGLSSLLDTVIVLGYQEQGDLLHRTVRVLKSRGMSHSSTRHRFRITDEGIRIDDPNNQAEGGAC